MPRGRTCTSGQGMKNGGDVGVSRVLVACGTPKTHSNKDTNLCGDGTDMKFLVEFDRSKRVKVFLKVLRHV